MLGPLDGTPAAPPVQAHPAAAAPGPAPAQDMLGITTTSHDGMETEELLLVWPVSGACWGNSPIETTPKSHPPSRPPAPLPLPPQPGNTANGSSKPIEEKSGKICKTAWVPSELPPQPCANPTCKSGGKGCMVCLGCMVVYYCSNR